MGKTMERRFLCENYNRQVRNALSKDSNIPNWKYHIQYVILIRYHCYFRSYAAISKLILPSKFRKPLFLHWNSDFIRTVRNPTPKLKPPPYKMNVIFARRHRISATTAKISAEDRKYGPSRVVYERKRTSATERTILAIHRTITWWVCTQYNIHGCRWLHANWGNLRTRSSKDIGCVCRTTVCFPR